MNPDWFCRPDYATIFKVLCMHWRHRSSSLYQTDEHSNWRKRRLRLPPNWRELIRRKACWSDKKFNFIYVILASQMKMSFNKLFISYPFRRYIKWHERIRKRFRKTHQICLLSIFLRLESLSLGTSAARNRLLSWQSKQHLS